MSSPNRREGFALPMVILVIGFMTASVMAGFARAGTEARVVDHQRSQTTAFAVAQAGLEEFLTFGRPPTTCTTPGQVCRDTTLTLTGGSVRVRLTLLRPAPTRLDTAYYVVRSEATTAGGGNVPQGRRTVAQYAIHTRGVMQVLSAWTSLSGLHKNGASGIITGHDACTSDTVAGVAVPNNGYDQNGSGTVVFGDPPVEEMGTQSQMASQIKIDWAGITNPTSPRISPDLIRCFSGSYGYDASWGPCSGMPAPTYFSSNPNFWPVVVINGTASLTGALPAPGRGILIVTGDLTFGGGDQWDGIVLVGGKVTDNGSGRIQGAVISGLNVLKGDVVGQSSKLNGTKDYIYDSCNVEAAAGSMSRLAQLNNAWVDNWTAW